MLLIPRLRARLVRERDGVLLRLTGGPVDPANLLFAKARMQQVREVVQASSDAPATLDEQYADDFRQDPFYEPPDLVRALRQLIESPAVRRALGPVITHHGYGAGFVIGAGAGVFGAVLAAALWTSAGTLCGTAGTSAQQGWQHPERDRYGCGDPEQDPLPVPPHTPSVGEVVRQSERHDGHGDQHHLPLRHPGGERPARHAQHSERGGQEHGRSEDPQESGRC